MDFSTLQLGGISRPQTVLDVEVMGRDGPVTIGDVPLVVQIHPAESPALQGFIRAAGLLPKIEIDKSESFGAFLAAGDDLVIREKDMISHIICGWNIEGIEYSRQAFKELLNAFPELFDPIQAHVLIAFGKSGNSSAASKSGRPKKDTSKRTTD